MVRVWGFLSNKLIFRKKDNEWGQATAPSEEDLLSGYSWVV